MGALKGAHIWCWWTLFRKPKIGEKEEKEEEKKREKKRKRRERREKKRRKVIGDRNEISRAHRKLIESSKGQGYIPIQRKL